ncbi:hypothetical protein ONE63_006689 [Megalurothrips usitatus]|uniref:Uncharacterized protein n=1 Tax=Megalurothrips usitatus TaxID=439358 RepID=A0AAV7XXE1_9NEOP|nr:hypothetical protein ONE63_006689 [Megalurothrips usitatus]
MASKRVLSFDDAETAALFFVTMDRLKSEGREVKGENEVKEPAVKRRRVGVFERLGAKNEEQCSRKRNRNDREKRKNGNDYKKRKNLNNDRQKGKKANNDEKKGKTANEDGKKRNGNDDKVKTVIASTQNEKQKKNKEGDSY